MGSLQHLHPFVTTKWTLIGFEMQRPAAHVLDQSWVKMDEQGFRLRISAIQLYCKVKSAMHKHVQPCDADSSGAVEEIT